MELIIGFVIGIVSDVIRSVFVPASTEWLNKLIPSAKKKANLEDNILMLQVMEKLNTLGKDPNLAKHAHDGSEQFLRVLVSQQEAFVENAIEVIDSTHMTQIEMNVEAGRRADVARQQMERAIIDLERSNLLGKKQFLALKNAQESWNEYANSQAEFAAAEFEGGSIASLIFSSELEAMTISRTGELKRTLKQMREYKSGELEA